MTQYATFPSEDVIDSSLPNNVRTFSHSQKSETEPKPRSSQRLDSEDDSDSAVVNLTTASFDSVVRDTKADILLEFYGK